MRKIKEILKYNSFVRYFYGLYVSHGYYSFKRSYKDSSWKTILGNNAMEMLLNNYDFKTVLDLGSGEGIHSNILKNNGKKVTSLDYGDSVYFKECEDKDSCVIGNYVDLEFKDKFDCIWASHILEHQPNSKEFLDKVFKDLKDGGVLAITVPPAKNTIVGGHVHLYTPAILLYNLILSGFDCSQAQLLCYGYNISVIVKKKPADLSQVCYDGPDLYKLREYFPEEIKKEIEKKGHFKDKFTSINWK